MIEVSSRHAGYPICTECGIIHIGHNSPVCQDCQELTMSACDICGNMTPTEDLVELDTGDGDECCPNCASITNLQNTL